ncbi:MAG: hypothetical protein WBJ10_00945 [Daejeonella sp.]|uniref:hypothetical protein n=1 Tax=Daejeonella sp. TaxID=2805397 RepID=UPI003C725C28
MKQATLFLLAILFTFSCKPKAGDTAEQRLREENFDLKKKNDSLKLIIEKAQRTYEGDTIQKLPDSSPKNTEPTFAGQHDLTLQWISWDKPGSVIITPSENGWHSILGAQTNEESYLRIEGKISPINERELEFDGKIEHNVHSGAGKSCIKTGKQLFKATGTRKYWRLQNMLNCDGTTTDYVDIYF